MLLILFEGAVTQAKQLEQKTARQESEGLNAVFQIARDMIESVGNVYSFSA